MSEYKALRCVKDNSYFSVELLREADGKIYWVDLTVNSSKDIDCDWNQYIFHLSEPDDIERKKVQDDVWEFEAATSEAINYVEQCGEIYQDDKGDWHKKD